MEANKITLKTLVISIAAVFARLPVPFSAPRGMNPGLPGAGWLFYVRLLKGAWIGIKSLKSPFMIAWDAVPAAA